MPIVRRRQLLIFIAVAHVSMVGTTLLRVERAIPSPLVIVAVLVAAAIVAIGLTEHRLPRLSVAALRSSDDNLSPWRAGLFGLFWFISVVVAPLLPSPALGDGWASAAWTDVWFFTILTVTWVFTIGLPRPRPGSVLDRLEAQIERVGHFIDEGRFLTRKEARAPSVDPPPSARDIGGR